jgi:predicted nuclease with TOPRIM domain
MDIKELTGEVLSLRHELHQTRLQMKLESEEWQIKYAESQTQLQEVLKENSTLTPVIPDSLLQKRYTALKGNLNLKAV